MAGTLLNCFALFSFTTSAVFVVSWSFLLVVGIGHACFGIMQSSIVLLSAADERRGQAMGAIAVAIGAGPFGRLQTGVLADAIGAPLAVGGEVALAAVLVATVAITLPAIRQVSDSQEQTAGS